MSTFHGIYFNCSLSHNLFHYFSSVFLLWCVFLLSISATSTQILPSDTIVPPIMVPLPSHTIPSVALQTAIITQNSISPSMPINSSTLENSTGESQMFLLLTQTNNIISISMSDLASQKSSSILSIIPSQPVTVTNSKQQQSSKSAGLETTSLQSLAVAASTIAASLRSSSQTTPFVAALTATQLSTPSLQPSDSLRVIVSSATGSFSSSKTIVSFSAEFSESLAVQPKSISQAVEKQPATLDTDLPSATNMLYTTSYSLRSSSIQNSTLTTPVQTERPTVDIRGARGGMKIEIIVGIVVAITLSTVIILVVVTLSCYICCRTKKYEYNTGNEYRVTVQHWKHNSDHYTANRSESASLSSSRGSSFMSSFGLKPKVRPRYGSTPADRVTTVVNPEFFYSTPL